MGSPDVKYNKHPDVGPDREDGGGKEHTNIINLFDFSVFTTHSIDRNGCDDEQVKSSRSDNSRGTELSRGVVKKLNSFEDTEHDFGGGRTKGHEGKVSNGGVPNHFLNCTSYVTVLVFNFLNNSLRGNDLNSLHEDV